MKNIFPIRLSELLTENKLSKRGFAKKIGVSAMSVSDWTTGKVQPTAENIFIIAEFFSISADYLLGLEDETGSKTYNNYGIHNGNVKF